MAKRKWLDGRPIADYPSRSHIGWVVYTAGWVDLDLEEVPGNFNYGSLRHLPPGFPMILKDIVGDGMAISYHHDQGVLKLPVELLQPHRK